MSLVTLTPLDLVLAAILVLVLSALSLALRLGVARELTVAAARTVVQLLLVGFVLEAVFAWRGVGWVAAIGLVMLLVASREIMVRPRRRFRGAWGFGLGASGLFLSSFTVTVLALVVVIGNDPWYQPRYAIPLLGMLLGNTMTGIALSLDRLTQDAWQRRGELEGRLALGENWSQAVSGIRRDAARAGMIPIINAMAVAGVVSLPGTMTGQILAGVPPIEAVKYQILINFLIGAGTGFGVVAAVWAGSRRLTDPRERLRLDRLRTPVA